MSAKPVIIASAIAAICAIIVIIILLACSFAKVDMTHVGILFSHAARRIDRSKLYTAGRYYVGVGGEFFTYPITQLEMELPEFESRSADGLLLKLQVSLHYRIDKESLSKILSIFDHFGHHYDGYISRLAMNIIRDASARFSAFNYSEARNQVSLEMERDLRDDLSDIGFILESVQLLNVQFPANFSNSLANTLMLQQQVDQALRHKEAELVTLDGEYSKSNITAAGMIDDAKSEATNIVQNADAEAESLIKSLEMEGESHLNMINMFYNQIKESNPSLPEDQAQQQARTRFVQWYWMNQVGDSTASKNMAVSIPNGIQP